MNILVVNDDGYTAPGIAALVRGIQQKSMMCSFAHRRKIRVRLGTG